MKKLFYFITACLMLLLIYSLQDASSVKAGTLYAPVNATLQTHNLSIVPVNNYTNIYLSSFETNAINGTYVLASPLATGDYWTNTLNNGYYITNTFTSQGGDGCGNTPGYCILNYNNPGVIYYMSLTPNAPYPTTATGANQWTINNYCVNSAGIIYYGTNNVQESFTAYSLSTNLYFPVVSVIRAANIAENATTPTELFQAWGYNDDGSILDLLGMGAQHVPIGTPNNTSFTNSVIDAYGYGSSSGYGWDCVQYNMYANGVRVALLRGRAWTNGYGYFDFLVGNGTLFTQVIHTDPYGDIALGPQNNTSGTNVTFPQANIELTGNTLVDSNLAVSGHYAGSTNLGQPTVKMNSGFTGSPSVALDANASDSAGFITIKLPNTLGGAANTATLLTNTFSRTYSTVPHVVVSTENSIPENAFIWTVTVTTTNFTLTEPAGDIAPGQTNTISYIVIQ